MKGAKILKFLQSKTDLPVFDTFLGYEILLGQSEAVISGRAKLLYVSEEEIRFEGVAFFGSGLSIATSSLGEAKITGDIKRVERQ